MKLDAFEKIIRKIVREEIEYSLEKLISKPAKNEVRTVEKTQIPANRTALDEIRSIMGVEYNNLNETTDWKSKMENNPEFNEAPAYLKDALTRDYSELVKKFKK